METPSTHNPLESRIEILKGAAPDLSSATYKLSHESHTLGNALRWMLSKNPKVEYVGYSLPHPSEPKIHLRIQMYDGESSLTALMTALDNLDDLFGVIEEKYAGSLHRGKFEIGED